MSAPSRSVAIQMDPVEALDIKGDSTFVLGLEAQRRGYRLFDYPVAGLSWSPEGVSAPLRPLSLRDEPGHHYSAGTPERRDLSEMDVVDDRVLVVVVEAVVQGIRPHGDGAQQDRNPPVAHAH